MTKVASALYMETQRYWRAKRGHLPDSDLARLRADLDKQYLRTRVAGEVLETRPGMLFGSGTPHGSDEPRRQWHAVMDLVQPTLRCEVDDPLPPGVYREDTATQRHKRLGAGL